MHIYIYIYIYIYMKFDKNIVSEIVNFLIVKFLI